METISDRTISIWAYLFSDKFCWIVCKFISVGILAIVAYNGVWIFSDESLALRWQIGLFILICILAAIMIYAGNSKLLWSLHADSGWYHKYIASKGLAYVVKYPSERYWHRQYVDPQTARDLDRAIMRRVLGGREPAED